MMPIPTINVGFTGTRHGLTYPQRDALAQFVSGLYNLSLAARDLATYLKQPEPGILGFVAHGKCRGADDEFDAMANSYGLRVHLYPGPVTRWTAPCVGAYREHPPAPYLVRNRAIVDATHYLCGAPKDMTEQESGGTWYTVRYARTLGRPGFIFLPDGSVKDLT